MFLFTLRAGTDITTIDNNGRTPLQLAQAKLKLLQKSSSHNSEMTQVCTVRYTCLHTVTNPGPLLADKGTVSPDETNYLFEGLGC